jgi:hypothetical protein
VTSRHCEYRPDWTELVVVSAQLTPENCPGAL